VDLINRRAVVKSVRIESPKIDVVHRKNGQLNWAALAPETPAAPPGDSKEPPFVFSIASSRSRGARSGWSTRLRPKPFRFGLDNVSLSVAGLGNAPGAKAARALRLRHQAVEES